MLDGLISTQMMEGLIGSIVFFVLALIMFAIAYKVVDWVTPGKLSDELLGINRHDHKPNVALGIVAGSLFLGMCIILAAVIN